MRIMTKEKRALMIAKQQLKVIIKISDKIPSHLQTEFRRISEINNNMIEIFKEKEAKNV